MSHYLQQHQQRKEALLTLLNRSAQYFNGIQDEAKAASFQQFVTDLQNGDFSIVVVGEFSAGKSTFLNAVMGDRYLPSFTRETTATINFLKHKSKSPNGHTMQIDYKNPATPTKFAEATKDEIAKNVSTVGGEQVVQQIESVTLYLDSPLLEQGITLVDSPGLNGIAKGHAEVTERQIERSHACIYMFPASQPGSKSDFEVLAKLSERFDNIFLVLNQIDKIKQSEETVESVVERLGENYLTFFPDHTMPKIYPIAAYPALVARTKEQLEYPDNSMQKDHSADDRARFLKQSRMEDFEQRLWKFITGGEKTIQELRAPAEAIHHELAKRASFIKETIATLEDAKDADEINGRIAEVESDLQEIRKQVEQQKGTIQLEVKELVSDLENNVKSRIEAMRLGLESKMSSLNDLDTLQTQVERINKQVQYDCEELVAELDEEFTTAMRKKINAKYKEIALVANENLKQVETGGSVIRGIAFSASSDVVINMDNYDEKTKELEQQLEQLRQKSENTELKRLEARKVEREMEALKDQLASVQQEEAMKVQMLGARPSRERIELQETRQVARGGFFGTIGDTLFGKKSESYMDVEYDDSAQSQYDNERETLRENIEKSKQAIDSQLQSLRSKEITDPDVLEFKMRQINKQQQHVQEQRELYIKEYSEKLQKEQQRVLNNVRDEFDDYVSKIGREMVKSVRTNMKGKEELITKVIISALEEQFKQQSLQKKDELQQLVDILQSGEAERAETRKALELENEQLKALAKEVTEFIAEIESIQVDVIEQMTKQTVSSR